MSQSPREELRLQRYLDGWEIINRMIREDTSWGGRERNCFHLSSGSGDFIDISAASGLDYIQDGRALCQLDFDLDGRPDLALRNRDGPQLRLLKNTWPKGPEALWIRLEGRSCNRDAIGARITVTSAGRTRVKEVHAGAAFLSQSSRWTCFGLGKTSGVPEVRIRWPGGKTTEVGALAPTSRWLIIEGEKPARLPFRKPGRESLASDTERNSEASKDAGKDLAIETWLASPLAPPDLPWTDLQGRQRHIGEFSGKPLLLHLFSRDCAVCVAGLGAINSAGDKLAQKGALNLVASVDLGPVPAGKRDLLSRIQSPSIALRFQDRTLLGWNILFRQMFNHRRDLVVPTSFLIDKEGKIVKVYRGKTDPARYIEDIGRIPTSAGLRMKLAIPFTGSYLNPVFRRDLMELGNAYIEAGLAPQAQAVFKTTLTGREDNLDSLFNYAISTARSNQPEEAREIYLQILEKRPDHDDVRNNLGIIEVQAGRLARAREYFSAVLKNNPAHTEAALNLANTWNQEKKYGVSIDIYRQALVHDTQSAKLWHMLGYALFRNSLVEESINAEEVEESITAEENAIRLDPIAPDAYRDLAIILITTGDYRKAAAISVRGLKNNSNHAELLNNHGYALWKLGDVARAESEFKKSISSAPGFDRSYLNLARMLAEKTRPEDALNVLGALLRQIPGHPRAMEAAAAIRSGNP